jgi:6-phosphogluconolactonase
MTGGRELFIAGNADDLAREAASRLVQAAAHAIDVRGRFAIALSGGSTPRRLYQLLTQPPYRHAIDWSQTHLFFADERFVPHDDEDSTVRLVGETLLSGVDIPAGNFHAMPTEGDTPEGCASRYDTTLRDFFGGDRPDFDLILLGMGPDGHTASLFPGHPEPAGLVASVHDSPKPPPVRLTLTYAAIDAAHAVWFLVTGADKATPLERVFHSDPGDPQALPAARIHARNGQSVWLVDAAAGANLVNFIKD